MGLPLVSVRVSTTKKTPTTDTGIQIHMYPMHVWQSKRRIIEYQYRYAE